MILSIIIPSYNGHKTIIKALDSINIKEYKDVEVIVVLNGPKNKTKKILRKYNNIKIIETKKIGVSNARNIGITSSKGKYIIFLDDDDYFEPEYLKKIYNILINNNYDLIMTNYYYKYKNKKEKRIVTETKELYKKGLVNEGRMYSILESYTVNHTANKIFTRKIIDKYNLRYDNNVTYGEDLLFNLKYIIHASKIKLLPIYSYNYVIKDNSSKKIEVTNEIIQILNKYYSFENKDKIIRKIKIRSIYRNIFSSIKNKENITITEKFIDTNNGIMYFLLSINLYLPYHLTIFNSKILLKIKEIFKN